MKFVLITARSCALLGLAIGGGFGAYTVFEGRWVREFQAGAESPLSERIVALAHRGALEGLGFGLIGLVLGLLALLFVRGDGDSENSRDERRSGFFVLGLGAFVAWALGGTWLTDAALPFLRPQELVAMHAIGFLGTLLGLSLMAWLVKRAGGGRSHSVAIAIGTILALGVATLPAQAIVLSKSGGFREPLRLAGAAACYLAAIPIGMLFARALNGPVRGGAERLGRGPLVPPALRWVGLVVLFACVAGTLPFFQLSAVPPKVDYSTLAAPGKPAGPNVVLVTIDTLRAEQLGCYGYERDTSPFIDSLAAAGTRYDQPQASAAWTKPATGTILTGLYPSRHGALYHGSSLQTPEGERTLAEAFGDAGYATAGFVSNPNLKKVFQFDRGFDEYFDSPVEDTVTLASIRGSFFGKLVMKLARHQFNWKYENDVQQMNQHAFAWLEKNKDVPFFLYLHYIDPHIPYDPPEKYREQFEQDHGLALFNDRRQKVGVDLYDAEIRYSDDGMRDLVERLKSLGIWENTLFGLTSDHGEEFFEEHSYVPGETEEGVIGHGFSLFEPVIRVPLILTGVGVRPDNVVTAPTQILDLAATLLDLAGTGDVRLGDGSSFAESARQPDWTGPEYLFLENEFGQDHNANRDFVLNGVRSGPWKLVLTEQNINFPPEEFGSVALYNLEQDPGETVNLIDREEHRAVVERLTDELRAHAMFLDESGFRDIKPASISPEIEASMRALGYMGDE